MGARTTGDLSRRKDAGNQSMNGGGRYDNRAIKQMAEADSKKAVKKAQEKKMTANQVVINPDKTIMGGPGLQ